MHGGGRSPRRTCGRGCVPLAALGALCGALFLTEYSAGALVVVAACGTGAGASPAPRAGAPWRSSCGGFAACRRALGRAQPRRHGPARRPRGPERRPEVRRHDGRALGLPRDPLGGAAADRAEQARQQGAQHDAGDPALARLVGRGHVARRVLRGGLALRLQVAAREPAAVALHGFAPRPRRLAGGLQLRRERAARGRLALARSSSSSGRVSSSSSSRATPSSARGRGPCAAALLSLQALPLAHDALDPHWLHFQYPPYFPQLLQGMRRQLDVSDASGPLRAHGGRARRPRLVRRDAGLGAARDACATSTPCRSSSRPASCCSPRGRSTARSSPT